MSLSTEMAKGFLFINDRVTGRCSNCGGEAVEFSVPSPVWNKVVRSQTGGRESENEYLCVWCFADMAIVYLGGKKDG